MIDAPADHVAAVASKGERPVKPSGYKTRIKRQRSDGTTYHEELIPMSAKWYKQQCEWLWWMYSNNYTDINLSMRTEMILNRLYAEGRQPIGKYLPQWYKKRKRGNINRLKTYTNISFDIFTVMPKMVNYITGTFDKIDFNAQVVCVDEFAGMEREEEIWRQADMMEDRFFHDIASLTLGTQEQPTIPFQPRTKEEVKMLIDMGFIKIESEAEIEELLEEMSLESRWRETIKPKIHYDHFTQAWAGTKVYVDPVSKRVMCRYVDPVNAIVKYKRPDRFYQDISYAGEIVAYTFGDLRAAGIKGKQLNDAIRYYGGKIGNMAYEAMENVPDNYYDYRWNDMKVYVVDVEFESFDFRKYEWVELDGTKTTKEIDLESNVDGAVTTTYPKWHRAKWVVGTDICFDYGYQYDVPYTQYNKPQSTFSFVKTQERSPVNLCIADADDIQLLMLKKRAAQANMTPPGIVFDRNAFKEIEVGGLKFNWLDQMDMYRQTGTGIIENPTTPTGQAIPGVPPPFYETKGTIGVLMEYRQELENAIAQMATKLGISVPIEGTMPNPNVPVTSTQIALEGTNNITRPILMAYQSLKKQTFGKAMYMYEIRSKAGLIKEYSQIVGSEAIDLLKFVNSFHHGLHVETLIDDNMRQDIMMKASESLAAAKTGGIGIEFSDYFAISRMVERGLLKSAQLYLVYRENLRKKEAQDLQAQNMEMNRQTMMQQEDMKRQALVEATQMKFQGQQEVDTNRIMQEMMKEMQLLREEIRGNKEEISAQGQQDRQTIPVQAEADIKVEKSKPKPVVKPPK